MLEASGGSGPPKARVLWGPIGTDGVNRRAVSPRSVFAHEPRVVFRDNKRATSSSVGNDHDHPSLSLLLLSFPLFLPPSLPPSLLPSFRHTFFERVPFSFYNTKSLPPFDERRIFHCRGIGERNRRALKEVKKVAVYRERSANENRSRGRTGVRGIDWPALRIRPFRPEKSAFSPGIWIPFMVMPCLCVDSRRRRRFRTGGESMQIRGSQRLNFISCL